VLKLHSDDFVEQLCENQLMIFQTAIAPNYL